MNNKEDESQGQRKGQGKKIEPIELLTYICASFNEV